MRDSKVPEEWAGAAWTMHNVDAYRAMAQEPHFDYFLRVWFFSVANVAANGHATLRQGRLAHALGEVVDGVWQPARPDTVKRAVALAKDKGLLDPRSRALCLIPTRKVVAQGKGDPEARCPRHDRGSRVRHLRRVS